MDEKGESQINPKATTGLKRIYLFLRHSVRNLIIVAVLLFLSYVFIARSFTMSDNSMYPTIKGNSNVLEIIFNKNITHLSRGDIISYISPLNPNISSVARIIGLPGDKILIKNGFVYLNGNFLDEPYISAPGEVVTDYNGTVLGKDCQVIDVPQSHYFVLQDNRFAGLASIFDGYIDENMIFGFVPKNLIKFFIFNPINWFNTSRNTSHDKSMLGKSEINKAELIKLINAKRKENKLTPLVPEDSSNIIANLLLQDVITQKYSIFDTNKINNFFANPNLPKFEDKKQANVTTLSDKGFFTAQGLVNTYFNSPSYEKALLSNNYISIGVASAVTNINNCPQQLNVVLLFTK